MSIVVDVTKSPTKKEGNFQSKNATSAPELSESELEELDLFFAENDKTSRHGGSRPKQKDIDDVTVTKATKLGDVLSTPQLVVKETSKTRIKYSKKFFCEIAKSLNSRLNSSFE